MNTTVKKECPFVLWPNASYSFSKLDRHVATKVALQPATRLFSSSYSL